MHRGETVRKKIKETQFGIENLATELGISNPSIFRWLNNQNLPFQKIWRISEKTGIDFTKDFPEMKELKPSNLRGQLNNYKQKYHDQLEKNQLLMEELLRYKNGENSKH
jgi:transcriptional regulator with XRE-family HTH domain